MATESVFSEHHSPDKTMEKVEEEEGQTVKLEDVSPPKEVGGKYEGQKLDADGLAGSDAPVNKLEETTGMQPNLPASVEVDQVEETPVVDVHEEDDSEKIENCAPKQESLSAPGPGDEAVLTQSGEPEKQCVVVEKDDNPSIEDLPGEVDLKVVESSVLDPESDSAPKLHEKPEEHSVDVSTIDGASCIVNTPTEAGSKVVENPVLDPESSSVSEPGGEIVKRKLEAPEGDATEVERVVDAIFAEALAVSGSKMVESYVLEPESSPSEPVGVAVEKLSEENPTVVEKVDDTTVVDSELSSAPQPPREAPEEHPVEVEKVDNIPIVDSSIEAESLSSSEPSGETVQKQLEATKEQLSTEVVETQQREQVAAEAVEQPEEKPSVGTAEPGSLVEAVDKPVEHLEVIPAKESELEVEKVPEASTEPECKIAVDKPEEHLDVILVKHLQLEVAKVPEASSEAETPGLVTKLEEEAGERAEVIKGIEEETEETKPSESLRGEVMTSEGTMADKCEVKEPLKEEETSLDQEPVAFENSVPTNQEAQIDPKEEEGDSSTISDVIKKAVAQPKDKEGSGSEVAARLSKDETVEAAKVEEEKEEKCVIIEDSEGKSPKVEEPIQTETAKTDDRNDSDFVAEVSRDVEVVAEMKKMEDVKEDTPLSVEAGKDKDGQLKLSEVDAQETVKYNADNLESVKEESEKSDPPSVETLKNGDDTKTSAKPPKQDDSVKKHSNNLMSKVKQSIVKVKKAIIGKSPSSKVLQPEAKKGENVK